MYPTVDDRWKNAVNVTDAGYGHDKVHARRPRPLRRHQRLRHPVAKAWNDGAAMVSSRTRVGLSKMDIDALNQVCAGWNRPALVVGVASVRVVC